ncbi:hypothetical protein IKO50_01490 [bacterium]|nr:hypothetical protein [bacterium]
MDLTNWDTSNVTNM